MGTPNARALRVALIQAGRIVEDRTFTSRARITVGNEAKNTFIVPMGDVPRTTPVFDVTRDGYALRFSAGAEGRVSLEDGREHTLAELAAQGLTTLPLPETAKGRVAIGEVSLLFQFVTPPPPKPAPVLPKEIRRGVISQIDRSFLLILALSLGAHFAGAGYLALQPMPEEPELTLEDLQTDRFAKQILPMPKPPKPAEPDKPAVAETPKPAAKPADKVAAATKAARPSAADVRERVKKMGIVGVIGSAGPGDGAFGDLFRDSKLGDVASALENAGGVSVVSAEQATALGRKGNDTGDRATIDQLGTGGVKHVALRDHDAVAVKGRVVDEPIQIDTPEVDERALKSWMMGRKAAIQGCYERELKRTPSLKGRLLIRFEITSRGRVGGLRFDENTLSSPAVQLCIENLMHAWVLPFTPEEEAPVAFPFVFVPAAG